VQGEHAPGVGWAHIDAALGVELDLAWELDRDLDRLRSCRVGDDAGTADRLVRELDHGPAVRTGLVRLLMFFGRRVRLRTAGERKHPTSSRLTGAFDPGLRRFIAPPVGRAARFLPTM
jgi:hypothetical protein